MTTTIFFYDIPHLMLIPFACCPALCPAPEIPPPRRLACRLGGLRRVLTIISKYIFRDRLGIYSRKHEPLSPKAELRFRLVHNYSPVETKLLQKRGRARNKICFFMKG